MSNPKQTIAVQLDAALAGIAPSIVVFGTAAATVSGIMAFRTLQEGQLYRRLKGEVLSMARRLLHRWIAKEIESAAAAITFPVAEGDSYFMHIPDQPLPSDTVVRISQHLHDELDHKMDKKLLSGVVYWGTVNHHATFLKILDHHLWANPLFADYFGATRRMEAEVTAMTLSLFHGDTETMAATYAFGGTESILLAMLAYRNFAQTTRGIQHPEVILAETAHPAFDKAAAYFNIRLVKVPIDAVTKKICVKEVEKHITSRTVAVVGSAPSFPYGAVDDIEGLSELADRHEIGLHVDACLGGFVLQFLHGGSNGPGGAGRDEPFVIDFRLKGVTSISADIHKWGGAPKGASCVMFRSKALRHCHTFAFADYPGGLYVTSGVAGSRPGFVTACAWAALLLTGKEGFQQTAARVVATTKRIAEGIRSTVGLRLLVPDVETTVVPFTSDVFDIYLLMKRLGKRGFLLNPLQFPCGVHLGVTVEHTKEGVADRFLLCLQEEVSYLLEATKVTGFDKKHAALIYGSTQGIPDRSIVADVLKRYVDAYYHNGAFPNAHHPEDDGDS